MRLLEKLYRTPCAQEVAARELEEARLDLLKAEANQEHYNFMKSMLKERISRLEAKVQATEPS